MMFEQIEIPMIPRGPKPIEEIYQGFAGIETALNINEMVNHIVDHGANCLYDNYLETKMSKHVIRSNLAIYIDSMNMWKIKHDKGESEKKILYAWAEDEEGRPAKLDTWAVKSLRKEKKKAMATEHSILSDGNNSRPGSSSSVSLSLSTIGKLKHRFKSIANRAKEREAAISLANEIIDMESTGGKQRPKTAFSKGKSFRTPKKTGEKYEYQIQQIEDDEKTKIKVEVNPIEEKLRRDKELNILQKKMENDRRLKKQQEDAATAEYVKKQQYLIKTKEYTYDFEGNVLVLNEGKEKEKGTEPPQDGMAKTGFLDHPPEVIKTSIPREITKQQLAEKQRVLGTGNEMIRRHDAFERFKIQQKIEEGQVNNDPVFIMDYKNPTLAETLMAKEGVKVTLENGMIKEGPRPPKSAMNRTDYLKLIKERHKVGPQFIEEQKAINKKRDEEMKKMEASEEQKQRLLEKEKSTELLVIKALSQGIKIEGRDLLDKLVNTEAKIDLERFKEQPVNPKKSPDPNMKKLEKAPIPMEKLERITTYKKAPNEVLLDQKSIPQDNDDLRLLKKVRSEQIKPKKPEDPNVPQRLQKFHKKIDEFNEQIVQDELWGQNIYDPTAQLRKKENITGTAYKERHPKVQTSQKNFRERPLAASTIKLPKINS